MFKPLRFNDLLKAIPGLAHLQLTPHAAHHAKSTTYAHVKEQIEVDRVRASKHETKETHVRKEHEEDVKITHEHSHDRDRDHDQDDKPVVRRRVTEDTEVKKVERKDGHKVSETLEHVHTTVVSVAEVEMTPPHEPREETPLYARTHHHLVYTLDTPCAICGVRRSTLDNPRENPFKAKAIETHHYPVERSLMNACDPKKIHVAFPQVTDAESLEAFIDSEDNMMVLCDIHHRHPHYGIHHILAQDFFIQPYLFRGYQIVADEDEADKVQAANERVMRRHGHKDD